MALTSTTLSFACSSADTLLTLASVSGVVPGVLLSIDSEILQVATLTGVSTQVRVRRGVNGTASTAHAAAATVYVGVPADFAIPAQDIVVAPSGSVLTGQGPGAPPSYATTGVTTTSQTLTNPTINGTAFATGQAPILVEAVALSGTAIHSGTVTAKAFSAAALILRVIADITTVSTGASTLDVGYTATTATTSSDTLLDGVSAASLAVFDSMNAALDTGTNAKAQKAASGKWITVTEASGDATGLVGTLYIEYVLVA